MAFRLDPAKDLSENVRTLGVAQVDAVLKRLAIKSRQARAVHAARKTMKRLRALLRLIRPALDKKTFRANEERLKQIGHSLGGARDLQAMLECIARLEAAEPKAAKEPVGIALKTNLAARREEADRELLGRSGAVLRKDLRQVRQAFMDLRIKSDGADVIHASISKDYAAARRAFRSAYKADKDEAFHEWRKLVQRNWRQLLLIEAAWPSMIRPHIDIMHELADTLGDDHDLYMLAERVRGEGKVLGNPRQIDAYLALCRKRQGELRIRAALLGERLFSERPSSIAARLAACWRTQPAFAAALGKEKL